MEADKCTFLTIHLVSACGPNHSPASGGDISACGDDVSAYGYASVCYPMCMRTTMARSGDMGTWMIMSCNGD